ncbi:MAG: prolyl oligopeptidase family serine peptidase [Bifidobacteriaceae bacterium]|jgi:hypothetical protein|nr:prolyl oligopeptidase family serine peptidase [Bifidobacteriaceae bacterium]
MTSLENRDSQPARARTRPGIRSRLKSPAAWVVAALITCLVSAVGVGLVKSQFGAVTVKELRWETPSGHLQAAQLLIPKTATSQNPAPGIVSAHGWSDNRELQGPFYIELARRGYVVLNIDTYSHGDSDDLPNGEWWTDDNGANGVYDGVKLLASLPYVDASQIGVEGHSNGAYACNIAVKLDNKAAEPLIAAVLLQNNDPWYTGQEVYGQYFDGADPNWENVYQNRDVGVVASRLEEVFHRIRQADGSLTPGIVYLSQPTAQSFLNFGQDPAGLPQRQADTFYTERIDGKEAVRVIYNPNLSHVWGFVSKRVTAETVEFFDKTLPAPTPIAPDDQVWPWKFWFEVLGVVGCLVLFVAFALMLLRTRYFGVLRATEPVGPVAATAKGKVWLWGGLTATALFSAVSYPVAFAIGLLARPAFFNQERPWVLALWSLVCGLFVALVLFLNYRCYAKKQRIDLKRQGVWLGRGKLPRTVLAAAIAAVVAYTPAFLSYYLFKADFRIWFLVSLRPFEAERLVSVAKLLPFFLVFFVIAAIAANVFNYLRIGKREWVNTAVLAVFSALGPLIVLAVMYSSFFATGLMPGETLGFGLPSMAFWLYPMVVVLPLATVASRILYKATRNPYLPGIAVAILVTAIVCANAMTVQA